MISNLKAPHAIGKFSHEPAGLARGTQGGYARAMIENTAYRLATPDRWAEIMTDGQFDGDPHDVADGFIHLSAAHQVEGTLVKHYNDHERLVLVEIDLTALGDTVKWEVSRGGEKFPHVFGSIPVSAVRGIRHVLRNEDKDWVLPNDLGDRT
jgi:uncharacterized protein (DUF952 family)